MYNTHNDLSQCSSFAAKYVLMQSLKQQAQPLSEEDKKILEEHHRNSKNPEHPAHPEHPHHGEFLKSIPKRLGGAAIFGAGATAGADAVKGVLGQ
ncbi:hypothetical protein RBB50_009000 [Rhinocladiella similis]